jgi:hypothetical protein
MSDICLSSAAYLQTFIHNSCRMASAAVRVVHMTNVFCTCQLELTSKKRSVCLLHIVFCFNSRQKATKISLKYFLIIN